MCSIILYSALRSQAWPTAVRSFPEEEEGAEEEELVSACIPRLCACFFWVWPES